MYPIIEEGCSSWDSPVLQLCKYIWCSGRSLLVTFSSFHPNVGHITTPTPMHRGGPRFMFVKRKTMADAFEALKVVSGGDVCIRKKFRQAEREQSGKGMYVRCPSVSESRRHTRGVLYPAVCPQYWICLMRGQCTWRRSMCSQCLQIDE